MKKADRLFVAQLTSRTRRFEVDHPGDYATLNSNQPRDRTIWSGPGTLVVCEGMVSSANTFHPNVGRWDRLIIEHEARLNEQRGDESKNGVSMLSSSRHKSSGTMKAIASAAALGMNAVARAAVMSWAG